MCVEGRMGREWEGGWFGGLRENREGFWRFGRWWDCCSFGRLVCCVGWMCGVSDGADAVGRCNDECAFWHLSV